MISLPSLNVIYRQQVQIKQNVKWAQNDFIFIFDLNQTKLADIHTSCLNAFFSVQLLK